MSLYTHTYTKHFFFGGEKCRINLHNIKYAVDWQHFNSFKEVLEVVAFIAIRFGVHQL